MMGVWLMNAFVFDLFLQKFLVNATDEFDHSTSKISAVSSRCPNSDDGCLAYECICSASFLQDLGERHRWGR